jgi:hypothetical protein
MHREASMKTLLTPVVAGLFLTTTAAQTQTIRGVAVEDESRAPIVGAFVELLAAEDGRIAAAHTDSTGRFVLTPRRTGAFTLRVTHLAYATIESAALEINPGEAVSIELRMATRAIPLEPLVVTSRGDPRLRGFHERMRRPGFGRFVTREDIELRPGLRATELLRGMPGVQLTPVNVGSGNIITMRGGATGRCMPTIYIDGALAHQFPEATIDAFLMSGMLEGIEVYTGVTAPASLYPRSGGCGVVAFWTRTDGGRRFTWRRLFTAAGFIGAAVVGSSLLMN